jgi:hypothetical protein
MFIIVPSPQTAVPAAHPALVRPALAH